MTAPVSVSLSEDHTRAAFTIFHEKGNIITVAIVDALRAALEELENRTPLKLITIEGAGADFSFGASVPEHAPDRIAEVLPRMHQLIQDLFDAPAVTGAIVRGRCLGGGFELALACDFIFAADDAVFGLPEIALGIFPPAASALLPVRIGASRAARAILTGAAMPVDDWRATGLIELVAPVEKLNGEVDRWFMAHLASKSAVSLRHAAIAARAEPAHRVRELLPVLEQLYLNELMRTHDAVEGIAAFMAKRAPEWKNR
jgi:cyclohexa-1,5-dienecarbonyl-CoA hydratase